MDTRDRRRVDLDAVRTATTFIWCFGPSGAGKETAISNILAASNHPLRQLLGVSGEIAACDTSRDVGRPREDALLEEILEAAQPGATLLIKGQVRDLEATPPLPQALRRRAVSAVHRVAFLWASPLELNRRCVARGWPDCEHDHSQELAGQVHRVSALGLPTVWILSCQGGYKMSEPPYEPSR